MRTSIRVPTISAIPREAGYAGRVRRRTTSDPEVAA
jgi:hypothetical protein